MRTDTLFGSLPPQNKFELVFSLLHLTLASLFSQQLEGDFVCALISGLCVPALSAAKNILDRILDGPILLSVALPLNEPDSFSLGFRPTYAVACLAVEKLGSPITLN